MRKMRPGEPDKVNSLTRAELIELQKQRIKKVASDKINVIMPDWTQNNKLASAIEALYRVMEPKLTDAEKAVLKPHLDEWQPIVAIRTKSDSLEVKLNEMTTEALRTYSPETDGGWA